MPEVDRAVIGCLVIDDLIGIPLLCGLSIYLEKCGAVVRNFNCRESDTIHARLQEAFQQVRKAGELACVLAAGTGCYAALALAEQLPVDRLVLLDDDRLGNWRKNRNRMVDNVKLRRQVRRLSGYVRRNLPFCVSDVLLVAGNGGEGRLARIRDELCNGRTRFIAAQGDFWKKAASPNADDMKNGIYSYLRTGELPKSLAENPEMCIIYE